MNVCVCSTRAQAGPICNAAALIGWYGKGASLRCPVGRSARLLARAECRHASWLPYKACRSCARLAHLSPLPLYLHHLVAALVDAERLP